MNTLGNVLVNLDGVLCAHLALRVGRRSVVVCLERVKILQPFSNQSDDGRQGKLHVLLESRHTGADETERTGPVAERTVEEPAR